MVVMWDTSSHQARADATSRCPVIANLLGGNSAVLGVWALTVPLGQGLGLGIMAFALLLWGLVPHARPGGDPLPVPPLPDPDDARIRLASNACWWMGLFGGVEPLLWARVPLELELLRRDRARHPERPRPRYWLRCLCLFLVMLGLMIWGLAWLVAYAAATR
jgi:hypothetical protein